MIDLVTDALATHRLTRLIVQDSVFDRPREHTKKALHAAGYDKALELLRCPFCVSIYCAFGVVIARRVAPRAWSPVARALALSSVAGTLSSFV